MNKQRYLAELGQLLIFMTGADRDLTLRRFGDLFDEAGPAGVQDLTARIGSPTKNAIRLSRSYMPGCLTDEILFQGLDLTAQAPEPDPLPEGPEHSEPEKQADEAPSAAPHAAYDLPELPDLSEMPELPDLPGAEEAPLAEDVKETVQPEAEQPGEAPEEGEPEGEDDEAEEPKNVPPAPDAPRFIPMPLHEENEEEPGYAPERTRPAVERPMSLWAGVPLFILALIVLALPLAALVLVLLLVLLIPGAAVLGGAALAAVGGLWCVNYIADAVLLFGLAFFILGLALLVLWCGFALDVALVKLYIRAVVGLKHLFLGRSVS